MEIINCPPAIKAIRTHKKHNLGRCGWHGKIEVLCCPNEFIVELTTSSNTFFRNISEPSDRVKSSTDNPRTTDQHTRLKNRKCAQGKRIPVLTSGKNKNCYCCQCFCYAFWFKKVNLDLFPVCEEYSNEIKPDLTFHIIEGEDAELKEFPHMVSMLTRDDSKDQCVECEQCFVSF